MRRYLDEKIGQRTLAFEEGIAKGMLSTWIKKYLMDSEAGLENKKKTGNPFSALHTSNRLTEIEWLRLRVAKQEVEIARLKNEYMVEGSGAGKVFVTSSDMNIKSLRK